jgi:hypothetical protein
MFCFNAANNSLLKQIRNTRGLQHGIWTGWLTCDSVEQAHQDLRDEAT